MKQLMVVVCLLGTAFLSACSSRLFRTDCELVRVEGPPTNPNVSNSPRLPLLDNRGLPVRRLVCGKQREKEAIAATAAEDQVTSDRNRNGIYFGREIMSPNVFDLEQAEWWSKNQTKQFDGNLLMYRYMVDAWASMDTGEKIYNYHLRNPYKFDPSNRTTYMTLDLGTSEFSYLNGSGVIRVGSDTGTYMLWRLVKFDELINSLERVWNFEGKGEQAGLSKLRRPLYVTLRITDGKSHVTIAYERPDKIQVIDTALQVTAKNETSRLERGVGVSYDNNAMVQVLNTLYEEKYRHNESAYRSQLPNGLISIAEKLLLDPDYRNQLIGLSRAKGDKP